MKKSFLIFLFSIFMSNVGWADSFSHLQGQGLKVTSVSGSLKDAGLMVNDIIIKIANYKLKDAANLRPALDVLKSGRVVGVVIKRGSQTFNGNVQMTR